MFTLDEIKEAILKISDAEILSNDEDERESRVRFKKNGDIFIITTLAKDMASNTILKLSRLVKLPKNCNVKKEDAELICSMVNILNNTPCKVVYIYNEKNGVLDNRFYITNIYTDKLDQFEKMGSKDVVAANLVVLILGMILEVMITTQDIITESEKTGKANQSEGDANGK